MWKGKYSLVSPEKQQCRSRRVGLAEVVMLTSSAQQCLSDIALTKRCYVPFVARTPWLLTILIALLACIGVLEDGLRSGKRGDPDSGSGLDARALKRQDANVTTTALATASTTGGPQTASSTDYLTVSTTTTEQTLATAAKSTYITISTSPTTKDTGPPNSGTEVPSTASESYVLVTSDHDTTVSPTATAPKTGSSGYITISSPSPTTSDAGASTTILENTLESVYISISTAQGSEGHNGGQNDGPTTATPIDLTTAQSQYITIPTIIASTIVSDGSTYITYESVVTSFETAVPVSQSHDYQTTTDSNGQLITIQYLPASRSHRHVTTSFSTYWSTLQTIETLSDGQLTTEPATTEVITAVATATAGPDVPGEVKASQVQIGDHFDTSDYFIASYLAVIVAVLLKIVWAMVFSALKMMEPFFQLTQRGGATAKQSLLAEYLSSGYSMNHIRHIFSGHWVLLFGTIAYISISVLPPLATETSTVVATAYCDLPGGGQQPCNAVWVLNASVARGLEAILSLTAVLVFALIVLQWPRKSGIFSNPSSIATMASLLSHEETLNDFRHLDQSADGEQLSADSFGDHYTLSSYEVHPGSGLYRYGIVRTTSSLYSDPYSLTTPTTNLDYASRTHFSPLPNSETSVTKPFLQNNTSAIRPFPFTKRTVRDTTFLLTLLTLLAILIAYYFDGSSSSFNTWFNSDTFGPRFLLTSSAVIIDSHWKTLEREVRILVPYRRLAAGNATAEKSVLVEVGGTPVQALPGALWRGEWFHACIAFTAVLSDVLIVSVSGVPYSRAQIWQSFLVSSYLSMAILAWMVGCVGGVFWWRVKVEREGLGGRKMDTLVRVWLGVCDQGNSVRAEFEGWETSGGRKRDEACKERGGRYAGGWDGQGKWVVSKVS